MDSMLRTLRLGSNAGIQIVYLYFDGKYIVKYSYISSVFKSIILTEFHPQIRNNSNFNIRKYLKLNLEIYFLKSKN